MERINGSFGEIKMKQKLLQIIGGFCVSCDKRTKFDLDRVEQMQGEKKIVVYFGRCQECNSSYDLDYLMRVSHSGGKINYEKK